MDVYLSTAVIKVWPMTMEGPLGPTLEDDSLLPYFYLFHMNILVSSSSISSRVGSIRGEVLRMLFSLFNFS